MSDARWEFWIDRGGTFTDCIGFEPKTGRLLVTKVLSSDRAPLVGIRRLLGLNKDDPIPPSDIRMGTTVATNALLERRGTRCALIITDGFGDLLEIGTQTRPSLFDLHIEKPRPLPERVVEVDARLDRDGRVLARPDLRDVRARLDALFEAGFEAVAISVIHAYQDGTLERELGRVANSVGFRHVVLGHQVAGELGFLARTETAVLDAFLTPLLSDYLSGLLEQLPGSTLRLMQSSGGLCDARQFRGPNALLSGPAGGVVAARHIALSTGIDPAIAFDMGGTSTDVSRIGNELGRVYEIQTSGVVVRAPSMDIHTVAAGGGSICRYDGVSLSVGPQSAGSTPGPLCYGDPTASELTVTDMNLVLGRLRPDHFPFALDLDRPRRALSAIVDRMARAGVVRSADEVAQGFVDVANTKMAEAIRQVSVSRGYDVREHALVVFGGAAGQHACALANMLGIDTIVYSPLGSVLSAYGMGLADETWHGETDAGRRELATHSLRELEPSFAKLEEAGRAAVGTLAASGTVTAIRRIDLRYRGTESPLTLHYEPSADALRSRFHDEHERLYGHNRPGHTVEIAALRVEVIHHRDIAVDPAAAQPLGDGALETVRTQTPGPSPVDPSGAPRTSGLDRADSVELYMRGQRLADVPLYTRQALTAGTELTGPALVSDKTTTLVVEPGFRLTVTDHGNLTIERYRGAQTGPIADADHVGASDTEADPVLLEVMSNHYMSIAEQMGRVLQRTALSTNIRQRLDYSCAVFDDRGNLVANAPHIPVHLGSMGETVRALIEMHPDMQEGDSFTSNDPARGGSHLPDVTVVTPVFFKGRTPSFFVASRGHHADIGGITPGSMPPNSTALAEEGIVLAGLRIVHQGRFDRAGVRAVLVSGPYPARRPDENVADLEAQIAANRTGARLLGELVQARGLAQVLGYMGHVRSAAARKVAQVISELSDGAHRFSDRLDDGTEIAVTLQIRGDRLTVDFSGTGAEHPGNLNAPYAVTTACVLYFLRTLVEAPIPLNSGCLDPVDIRLPPASILSPGADRAVAGGNVETSQRVVDVLLAAAKKLAASQGTMNNLTFGDDSFGYYETIAGGAGAGREFPGASAVHTHMTNTRITDPEVLESRYPLRLLTFAVRRGSGGAGRQPGGDGAVREFEILSPVEISIVSERRSEGPFGLEGGHAGAPGQNFHNDRPVPGRFTLQAKAGDRIRIETPGGGGFGQPDGA